MNTDKRKHSTYSSWQFLRSLVEHAPFMIREVQTDNGFEFTKKLKSNDPNDKTLFEQELENLGIIHHLIRPATPPAQRKSGAAAQD